MNIWEMNVWELFKAGGPVMILIFFSSIVVVAITIEKFMYLAKINKTNLEFKQRIFDLVKANDISKAVRECESNSLPLANILKAGIMKFGSSTEEIKQGMEDASYFEIPKIEERLHLLWTISQTLPLLGLLGTVMGIAGSFYTIQVRATSLNPVTASDLAGGIWQALLTTVASLIIAIPSFVVYNYLNSRIGALTLDMEHTAIALADVLNQLSQAKNTDEEGEI